MTRQLALPALLLAALLISLPAPAAVQTFYVDGAGGNDVPGGGSSGAPWKTIGYALTQVSGTSADPVDILIAEGDYDGPLVLSDWVRLYGGFESALWTRDLSTRITTIDGNGTLHTLTVADDTRLDGLVITGGDANGTDDDRRGGGIFCRQKTGVVVVDSVVAFNNSVDIGGGLVGLDCSFTIERNVFVGNTSLREGAAIYLGDDGAIPGSPPPSTVVDNVVTDNFADALGGVLHFQFHDVTLSRNRIVGNRGDDNIVMGRSSGGVWSNNELSGNDGNDTEPGNGDLIYSFGGSTFRLVNNTLVGQHDAALELERSFPVGDPQHDVVNNIFAGHVTAIREGSLNTDAYPVGNLFFDNTLDMRDESQDYNGANEINLGVAEAASNVTGDPAFALGASGSWSNNAVPNPSSFTTTLIDASTIPGAAGDGYVGALVNPDTAQSRQFVIVASTSNSLTVWGNAAGLGLTGASYQISSLQLTNGSEALDRGVLTDPDLPGVDIEGDARPGADGRVDIGSDEAPAAFDPALDTNDPVSLIVGFPAFHTTTTFPVPYQASDAESGLAAVRLYFRLGSSGAFTQFGADFTASPITFTSPAGEGTYELYTRAVDNRGNVEAPPPFADAATLVQGSFAGSVVYVDRDATGVQSGESWADALLLPGQAAELAGAFAVPEVWVAAGSYVDTVSVPDAVSLLGGFDGTETAASQADPDLHRATIDGGGAFHVVTVGDNSRLEGFTVTGGLASGNGDDRRGAGVFCREKSGVVIRGNTIAGNTASNNGGGLYAVDCSVVIEGNVFVGNTSVLEGAAVYLGDDGAIPGSPAPSTVADNLFTDNFASDLGGVVHFQFHDATLSRNRIVGNRGDDNIVMGRSSGGVWSNNEMAGNDGNDTDPGDGFLIFAFGGSTFRLVNNTLVGQHDAAVQLESSFPTGDPQIDAVNNILAGHVIAIRENNNAADLSPVANLFWGNTTDMRDESTTLTGADAINLNVAGAADNVEGDPLFETGPSGTWSVDATYDADQRATTLTDGAIIPGAAANGLAGRLVNPDTTQSRWFVIRESADKTLTVWGDASGLGLGGSEYSVESLRLADGSAAIDRGDLLDPDLPPDDVEGDARPGGDALVDIGSDESPDAFLPAADGTAPVSFIVDLPAFHISASFPVAYLASDAGSGVDRVRLFYRFDGAGAYTQFGGDFTESPIAFTAPSGEGVYDLYTVAIDGDGNVEAAPGVPDATTLIRTSFNGSVVHVDADATGLQTGESWQDALVSPDQGLLLAGAFGAPEVWVAEGTYTGAVVVPDDVAFLGGFAGVESAAGEAAPDLHPTTIDGAGAFHTVTVGADSRVEGFTITGGQAVGNGDDRKGGGIFCREQDGVVIRGNTIAGNEASNSGGGLSAVDCSVLLEGNVFVGNTSVLEGAAAYLGDDGAIPGSPLPSTVRDNLFTDNFAGSLGGILHFQFHDATLTGNAIVGNRGDDSVVMARSSGGVWSNNQMAGNDGNDTDSGDGFLIYAFGASTVRLINNTLIGNHDAALQLEGEPAGDPQIDAVNNIFAGHQMAIRENDSGADAYPIHNLFFGNAVDMRQSLIDFTGAAAINAGINGATGNVDGDPLFVDGPSGSWSEDAVYDSDSFTTVLTDGNGGLGGLSGMWVRPDTDGPLMFVVRESTDTTLIVWGDASTSGAGGAAYQVTSGRISSVGAADGQGDTGDPDLPFDDIDGEPRLGPDDTVDIGADEVDLPAIGDRVWDDLDGDGIQDDGEPGLIAAVVYLFDDSGGFVDVTFTDVNGLYRFKDLTAGATYVVRFIPPPGYVLAPQDQGTDDSADSDADPATGDSVPLVADVGLTPFEVDAGMVSGLPCFPPDEAIYLYSMRLSDDGSDYPILDFMDFNQPDQVTGYHVYRSSDAALDPEMWPLVATDIVDGDEATPNNQWVDISGDVSPSGVWYYQVTAFNHRCPAEGPR